MFRLKGVDSGLGLRRGILGGSETARLIFRHEAVSVSVEPQEGRFQPSAAIRGEHDLKKHPLEPPERALAEVLSYSQKMSINDSEVRTLIHRLQQQMNRAVEVFQEARGTELSEHVCAMRGNMNDLLAHNAEHEKMHAGQISDRRYSMGRIQRTPRERYLAEWYRERANLVSLLLDLPDGALDVVTEDGFTTIRQIVEHVLYWDTDSVEHSSVALQPQPQMTGGSEGT